MTNALGIIMGHRELPRRLFPRARLDVDREQVVRDRQSRMSLTQVARKHGISRASVCRIVKELGAEPQMSAAEA